MTAPDERIYCSDHWCDGEHLTEAEKCIGYDQPIDAGDEPPC